MTTNSIINKLKNKKKKKRKRKKKETAAHLCSLNNDDTHCFWLLLFYFLSMFGKGINIKIEF